MTKEQKYADQLKDLGIYEPAFEPTIHQLAILEREQARTRKAWKKSADDGSTVDIGMDSSSALSIADMPVLVKAMHSKR